MWENAPACGGLHLNAKIKYRSEIAEAMREGDSQAVFAHCLNLTTSYISQIERGVKKPRGATLKLLSLVEAKGLDAIL